MHISKDLGAKMLFLFVCFLFSISYLQLKKVFSDVYVPCKYNKMLHLPAWCRSSTGAKLLMSHSLVEGP